MQRLFDNIEGTFTFPTLYKDMVARFPSGSFFVEVGCYVGKSLSFLIEEVENSGKQMNIISVDLFVDLDNNFDLARMNKFLNNMFTVSDKFNLIEGDSFKLASKFLDNTLYFVFIDANHNYEYVKKDILAWFPKVKEGGVLAGHDYSSDFCGVIEAVGEIFGTDWNKKYINELCWLYEKHT